LKHKHRKFNQFTNSFSGPTHKLLPLRIWLLFHLLEERSRCWWMNLSQQHWCKLPSTGQSSLNLWTEDLISKCCWPPWNKIKSLQWWNLTKIWITKYYLDNC
jgi:hypothetical protein